METRRDRGRRHQKGSYELHTLKFFVFVFPERACTKQGDQLIRLGKEDEINTCNAGG